MEERARRRDLLVGDDEVYDFYDARVPAEVVSAQHFNAWWRKQRHVTPELLTLTREDLLRTPETVDADRPDAWQAGDVVLPLTYRFEPGATDDGVTVHVPIDVLARLGGDEFAWQVPALREELVTALIRSLPKDLRRNFVPAPDTARAVLAGIDTESDEPLLTALQRQLRRRTGILVPIDAFDLDKLPSHLRVTFAVESPEGAEIASGQGFAGASTDDWQRQPFERWPIQLPPKSNAPVCGVGRKTSSSYLRALNALSTDARCADIPLSSTQARPSNCGCLRRRVNSRKRWVPASVDCCG